MDDYKSWPFPDKPNFLWKFNSRICLTVVSLLSKFWLKLNNVTVYNKNGLYNALDNRPADQGLVTVCNHYSCLDEPLLWGTLSLRHIFLQPHIMRWTLTAYDICFTKVIHAWFFSHGRCVPVVRGGGVYQRGMNYVLDKLNQGSWVHTFPEGKVNMTKEYLRLKWGVGRLISECNHTPMVVPMYHVGMDEILPNEPPYIPQVGKKVTILIGKPMDFKEQLKELRKENKSPMEMRKAVTDRIQAELVVLRREAEYLHYHENSSQKLPQIDQSKEVEDSGKNQPDTHQR